MQESWPEIVSILERERLLDASQLNPGASEAQLAQLEAHVGHALPVELRVFLAEHNGQQSEARLGICGGRLILSTAEIRRQWDVWRSINEDAMNADCADFMSSKPPGAVKPMYTNRHWIALTHDHGGNHIGLDFDPDTLGVSGQVIAFGRDEDQKRLLANSFKEYLPILLAQLRTADWTFANGLR